MLARHNGSIEISKFDLPNFANLRSALHRILFDESYQRNAENLAKRLEKQPFKPKEMLVRHFEFGAEFGIQPGLDCNIRNMTFAEYFLLDVLAFFATCATVIIVLVYLVLKRVVSVIKSVRSKSKLE
uniref:glucuronosyltransferase n=1 Tax=Caenorhabditis japonica TaxID=281687 RepID=A0A8R1IRB4_CAEJA